MKRSPPRRLGAVEPSLQEWSPTPLEDKPRSVDVGLDRQAGPVLTGYLLDQSGLLSLL